MPALLKTTQIQEPSSASVNLTLDTSGNGTFAGTSVMSSPYTMRNKIINGAMVIDQRNAGASVTPTNGQYGVDRWQFNASAASKFTAQQVTDAPTGFGYSIKMTSSSAYTAGASELFATMQPIEGFNFYDLCFGTASAKTITISFWVKSSLTGTFGGSLSNYAQNRFYPFSYTISSANTWEQKTVTITGDTSGTWVGASSAGAAYLWFSIGAGSSLSQAAGSWTSSSGYSATGATSVVGTNGATFYITGVQLERGTVATPFEYRNYQQELAMCQRYYEMSYDIGVAPGTASNTSGVTAAAIFGLSGVVSTGLIMSIFKVTKRATPTITLYSPNNGASGNVYQFGAANNKAGASQYIGMNSFQGYSTALTDSGDINFGYHWTAASEL